MLNGPDIYHTLETDAFEVDLVLKKIMANAEGEEPQRPMPKTKDSDFHPCQPIISPSKLQKFNSIIKEYSQPSKQHPQPAESRSQFQLACRRLLEDLKAFEPFSSPFLARVTRREAPTYHLIITKPMDLGTMTRKFLGLQYRTKAEIADDLNLIWENCFRFNSSLDNIYNFYASKMKQRADFLLSSLPEVDLSDDDINTLPTQVEAQSVSSEATNRLIDKQLNLMLAENNGCFLSRDDFEPFLSDGDEIDFRFRTQRKRIPFLIRRRRLCDCILGLTKESRSSEQMSLFLQRFRDHDSYPEFEFFYNSVPLCSHSFLSNDLPGFFQDEMDRSMKKHKSLAEARAHNPLSSLALVPVTNQLSGFLLQQCIAGLLVEMQFERAESRVISWLSSLMALFVDEILFLIHEMRDEGMDNDAVIGRLLFTLAQAGSGDDSMVSFIDWVVGSSNKNPSFPNTPGTDEPEQEGATECLGPPGVNGID